MSRPISLFANYHKEEDSVTNFCGLVLKLLFEENPRSFEKVLINLIGEDSKLKIGPSFNQQSKKIINTPDLEINQQSIQILFETKLKDWFYDTQIKNHLGSFNEKSEIKIMFLLCNFDNENYETRFRIGIEEAKKNNIYFRPISFEEFIYAIKSERSSENFKNILDEFEQYLDENGHLPNWKYLLDVVSCRNTMHEIEENVYICPNYGGAYSHRRALYFGAYIEKTVVKILEIKAVVTINDSELNAEILYNNTDISIEILQQEAKKKVLQYPDRIKQLAQFPLKIFLLDKPFPTNFQKESLGGLRTKTYFDVKHSGVNNSESLAKALNGNNWESFEKKSF